MNSTFRRPAMRSFLPSYERNAVLQLILVTGVCYIGFFFTAVCMQAFARSRYEEALALITPWVALPGPALFLKKAWTLLTYGFFTPQFLGWVSNAIWTYFWGNVLQILIGYRNIFPVFVLGSILGGLAAMAMHLIPGVAAPSLLLGAQAGILAMAAATFVLSPNYKFWFTPTFFLSIKVVLPIYLLLTYFSMPAGVFMLGWLTGGALGGILYVGLLRRGIRIGDSIYGATEELSRRVAPPEQPAPQNRRAGVVQRREKTTPYQNPQARVDALLEKILAKGYDALTQEEKEFLKQAGENI